MEDLLKMNPEKWTIVGVLGIAAFAFAIQQIRFLLIFLYNTFLKKSDSQATQAGAGGTGEAGDDIFKFLEVSNIVRENTIVLKQVSESVDKMSKAQDQIYDLIRNHESRVSRLEGIDKGRREGRGG